MRSMAIVLLLLMGVAFPYVVGYHLDPVKAQWSGWALGDENHGVAQTVVACWDSLERVELFAGARGNGGAYYASVYEGNTLRDFGDTVLNSYLLTSSSLL